MSKSLQKTHKTSKHRRPKNGSVEKDKIKLFEITCKSTQDKEETVLQERNARLLNNFTGKGVLLLPTGKKYEG